MRESIKAPHAVATIIHREPTRHLPDGSPDPTSYVEVARFEVKNLVTDAGKDFFSLQAYGSAGLAANGLNFIALSDDPLTETAGSTVLSNEIAANGLERAQGVYAHTPGTSTLTVTNTFTASGAQSCQKTALFTALAGGVMNHVLAFPQQALAPGGELQVTFTITLGV